jgi:hypothetical protein
MIKISGYQSTSYVQIREFSGSSDFKELQNCMWRILTVTYFLEDKNVNILKRGVVNLDEAGCM